VGAGALIPVAPSSRNDYGYTIGGPIFIPGVFNTDKKKLFFFLSQEKESRTDPATQRTGRVPTALERRGDFSQSVDASGNPFPYKLHVRSVHPGPGDPIVVRAEKPAGMTSTGAAPPRRRTSASRPSSAGRDSDQ